MSLDKLRAKLQNRQADRQDTPVEDTPLDRKRKVDAAISIGIQMMKTQMTDMQRDRLNEVLQPIDEGFEEADETLRVKEHICAVSGEIWLLVRNLVFAESLSDPEYEFDPFALEIIIAERSAQIIDDLCKWQAAGKRAFLRSKVLPIIDDAITEAGLPLNADNIREVAGGILYKIKHT